MPSGPLTPGVTVLPFTHGEGPLHPNNSQHWVNTFVLTIRFHLHSFSF